MPVRYTFSGNLFRVNLEGSYTPEEIMETFMNALNDPLFPEDARFLLDVRKSSELSERSYSDIRSVAQFFAALFSPDGTDKLTAAAQSRRS